MAQDLQIGFIALSLIVTYAVLLWVLPGYREDTKKMFHLEMSSLRVLLCNPHATFVHIRSLVVPLWLMGLI